MRRLVDNLLFRRILFLQIVSLFAVRLIVIAHEFVGHGLVEWMSGVSIQGYFASYFGGAFLVSNLTNNQMPTYLVSVAAGCGVQLIMGIICFFCSTASKNKSPLMSFILEVTATWCLLLALTYLLSSITNVDGDGYNLVRYLSSSWQQFVFVILSVALAEISFLMIYMLSRHFNCWFMGFSRIKSSFLCLLTALFVTELMPMLELKLIQGSPASGEIVEHFLNLNKFSFPLGFFPFLLVVLPAAIGVCFSPPCSESSQTISPSLRNIAAIGVIYFVTLAGVFLLRSSPLCIINIP